MNIAKLDLTNTTLIAIDSQKISKTLKAIEICCQYVNFYKILFFSDVPNPYQVSIPRINSIKDYDSFVVHSLPNYISSDYCLTIHWDGFIVNPSAWNDQFLNYDYIGAPWPWMNYICGNGGFSLKSKKFLEAQKDIIPKNHLIDRQDDVILCVDFRQQFEAIGCKYAPKTVSQKFSTEYGGYFNYNSFGFHDFRPNPQFKKLLDL